MVVQPYIQFGITVWQILFNKRDETHRTLNSGVEFHHFLTEVIGCELELVSIGAEGEWTGHDTGVVAAPAIPRTSNLNIFRCHNPSMQVLVDTGQGRT